MKRKGWFSSQALRRLTVPSYACVLAASGCRLAGAGASATLPPTVLWAWERPEDLRFIDPSRTAVAYLAGTIRLSGDAVVTTPRLQSLAFPETTTVLAVVRFEVSRRDPPVLSSRQREGAAAAVLRLVKERDVQLDFDARSSERGFYAELIRDVRQRLPDRFLSITALASWCLGDPWIAGLPIDEAVPMLFRMGVGETETRELLAQDVDFRLSVCRHSAGVATDERAPPIPTGRRRYWFHPKPWSESAYKAASHNQDVLW